MYRSAPCKRHNRALCYSSELTAEVETLKRLVENRHSSDCSIALASFEVCEQRQNREQNSTEGQSLSEKTLSMASPATIMNFR